MSPERVTADLGPWRRAVQLGALWSGVAVFISTVGMVEALSERQIVVDVLSLGMSLLLITELAAGYGAAAPGHGPPLAAVARGGLAGALVAVATALLVALGSTVNLRAVLVSASPQMYTLLSFGRGVGGAPLMILVGAAVGALGAAASLLPARIRGPLVSAVGVGFAVGLFQELVQLMLGAGPTGTALRNLLFSDLGLVRRGAVIVLGVAWVITVLWATRGSAVSGWVAGRPARQRRALRVAGAVAAVYAIYQLPNVAGPFISQVLVLVGLYTLMGLGLNLEIGFAGLLDLGFVAFFAIGAYTVGLLTSFGEHGLVQLSFWTAVPIAVLTSLIAGVALGVPVLRIRGDYLAIATLGFGEIVRLMVLSDFLRPWLGGSQGVLGIPKPTLGTFEFAGPEELFYLTIIASALVAFVAARLRDSRLGRAWMALREDEDVAEAMGINLVNVKLLAYGLGAAFAGVSGAIFAVMVASVFPHSFQLLISINVLALIIVGGIGSMPGVAVGSLFLIGMPELLREFSDFRFLVYGAALVMMMQLRPEGLWPAAALRRELHGEDETPVPPIAGGATPAPGGEG